MQDNQPTFKRVVATLNNNQSIYMYNMDKEVDDLESSIVVSGLPEAVESSNGSMQYKLSHPKSGWFCSIGAEDTARSKALLQTEDGILLLEIKPLKTYSVKDLKTAKPFLVGGAK